MYVISIPFKQMKRSANKLLMFCLYTAHKGSLSVNVMTICLQYLWIFYAQDLCLSPVLWGQKSSMGTKICNQFPCQVASCTYKLEFKSYQSEINRVRLSPFGNFISFESQTQYEARALLFWSMTTSKTRLPWGPAPAECNTLSPSPNEIGCMLEVAARCAGGY